MEQNWTSFLGVVGTREEAADYVFVKWKYTKNVNVINKKGAESQAQYAGYLKYGFTNGHHVAGGTIGR